MILMVVAVLLGAVMQSATGFGFAQVSSPGVFHALEPDAAVTVVALLSLGLSLLVLYGERRRHVARRRETDVVLAWALPGLGLGLLVLGAVGKPALQVGVGVAVVAAVVVDAVTTKGADLQAAPRPIPTPPVGVLAGALTMTTGVNGPPLMIWFQRRGASPGEVRDSLAVCFAILSAFSLLVLLAAGRLDLGPVDLPWLALLGVVIVLGRAAGRQAFLRLDSHRFRTAGVVLALCAGLASMAAGLAA